MNKNFILSLFTTALILAVVAGGYYLFKTGKVALPGLKEPRKTGTIEVVDAVKAQPQGAEASTNATQAAGRVKTRVQRINSRDLLNSRTDIPAKERDMLIAINDALEVESLDDLLKVLPEASVSTNVEVRSDLVDALGWFGKSAMLDLMPFMADPDEDVAQAAMDSWTMSLSDINNERRKCELVGKALQILSNEEALESMLLELSDCDDLLVLQTLINVIEAPGASAASTKVALEHYEFTTGEKYSTFEAAESWLANNYETDTEDADGAGREDAPATAVAEAEDAGKNAASFQDGEDKAAASAPSSSSSPIVSSPFTAGGEPAVAGGRDDEAEAPQVRDDEDGSGDDEDADTDVEGEPEEEEEEDEEASLDGAQGGGQPSAPATAAPAA